VRKQVFYSGHVQGVGFRWTARNIAQGYDLNGYVKNLPDDRVEVQVEGEETELNAFFTELEAEMAGFVREKEEHLNNPGPELPGGFRALKD